jgi:hypothetical protein
VQIGAALLCKGAKVNHNNPWWRVTGTGIGSSGNRPFSHRELAPGLQELTAERRTSERLTTGAVTCHPKLYFRHKKAPEAGG